MRYRSSVSGDTSAKATAVQTEIYRRIGPEARCALAAWMSAAAREITLAGIRHRHPEYDAAQARWALFRMLVGDTLFRRAWPDAPVLSP